MQNTNKIKWQERWYLVLIIAPVLVGFLTNVITWDNIKSNPLIAVSIVLFLYACIISFEFFRYYKKHTQTISQHDSTIITTLIQTLNIEHAYESLHEQNAWYGYEREHILGFLVFSQDAKKLVNRISNKRIQKLIDNVVAAIDDFNKVGAQKLYSQNGEYVLDDIHVVGLKERELTAEQLNKLAKIAYAKIELLTHELKRYNTIDLNPPKPKKARKKSEFWNSST